MNELLQLCITAAKARGHMGVAVWDQGGAHGHVAGCLNRNAGISDPRSWESHCTPADALMDLAKRLGVRDQNEHAAPAATEA